MAQDKKKSPVQIAGENEAMAADNVTVDPNYVAEVEAQQAQMDSTLQAERIIALEEAENNTDPIPNLDFQNDVQAQRQATKNAAQAEIAKSFDLFDIAEDLGLKFQKFESGEE